MKIPGLSACLHACKCVRACVCAHVCVRWQATDQWNLLEEVVTMRSLSFDFVRHTYNRFEGEIVAEKTEWEWKVARRGWRPCSHEPWMETESRRGGVKKRIVLHSKVLLKKKSARGSVCVGGDTKRSAMKGACQSEDVLSLSFQFYPPSESGMRRGLSASQR